MNENALPTLYLDERDQSLVVLDQTRLPGETAWLRHRRGGGAGAVCERLSARGGA